MSYTKSTYTVTFGENVENGVGMQQIGEMGESGFSVKELKDAKREFESEGCVCALVDLNAAAPDGLETEPACVLIIRGGAKLFTDPDNLYKEIEGKEWDEKKKMRGRVVNTHARHVLCFTDEEQSPDYENGKGRVYSFESLPCLAEIRKYMPSYLGVKAYLLYAEGNYYYDVKKCGIGRHGDAERKMVIAVRLGASMILEYYWYHEGVHVGKCVSATLNHGDMYVMSEKATGFDWLTRKKPTLRHTAGCEAFRYKSGKPDEFMYVE